MLFESIPRGSLAAMLTAADLLSRLESYPDKTLELRRAVAVVCGYMLDPNRHVRRSELDLSVRVVRRLSSL